MAKTFKFFHDKMGGTAATSYIGTAGEIFYNADVGDLRISDGQTPGGILLYSSSGAGATGYCGTFFDTQTQTSAGANQVNLLKYRTNDIVDGISIVADTKITMAHAARYNIQFSAQLDKTDSGVDQVDVWLKKNGSNVDYSNTRVDMPKVDAKVVAAWNWVAEASAGDYYEIAWSSADADMRIYAEGEQTNPTRPGIPSVILTVTQV
jgi:uncharacterized protein (DUF736 family)